MAQIALSYAKSGNPDQAEAFIRRARTQDKNDLNILYSEAQVNALLGKQIEALELLQDALEKHYSAEAMVGDPDLNNLRNNPEFNSLIKKYSKKGP